MKIGKPVLINRLRVVIAGGGTGGHLFPGIAIAEAIHEKVPGCKVLFIGTDRPFEKTTLSEKGFDHETIFIRAFKGKGLWNKLAALVVFPWAVCQAVRKIRRFGANLVVGVGGYSAAPVAVGAWMMGIRVVIQEQNILPGMTNRLLARLASRIYVSFENTRMPGDPKKVCLSGNPVRREVLTFAGKRSSRDHGEQHRLTVLILGGSQGAHSINLAVAAALDELADTTGLNFIHQTGTADEKDMRAAYVDHGVPCRVKPFFKDIGAEYARADLLICRAGATTVAEAAVLGKACIFIPYPFAAENHQELNARVLVKDGAAGMILEKDLNGRTLARLIQYYLTHRQALIYMADRARAFGRPHAAMTIVEDCLNIMVKKQLFALSLLGLSGLKWRRPSRGQ